MGRRAINPDAFQSEHYAFQDLLKVQPVLNDALFEQLTKTEVAGQTITANGGRPVAYVAKFLRQDFIAAGDANVEPPLSDEQRATLAAKAGYYAMLLERDSPTHGAQPARPTPTAAIDTSARKT